MNRTVIFLYVVLKSCTKKRDDLSSQIQIIVINITLAILLFSSLPHNYKKLFSYRLGQIFRPLVRELIAAITFLLNILSTTFLTVPVKKKCVTPDDSKLYYILVLLFMQLP